MAEEKIDSRELTWQRLLPWSLLFRTFQVTLDLNKLLLAAAASWRPGSAGGCWRCRSPPTTSRPRRTGTTASTSPTRYESSPAAAWKAFLADREQWNLMNEAVGLSPGSSPATYQLADVVETLDEYNDFSKVLKGVAPGPDTVKAYLDEIARRQQLRWTAPRRPTAIARRAGRFALIGQLKPRAGSPSAPGPRTAAPTRTCW